MFFSSLYNTKSFELSAVHSDDGLYTTFKGHRHPVTFTFYNNTSIHGDLNSSWNCLYCLRNFFLKLQKVHSKIQKGLLYLWIAIFFKKHSPKFNFYSVIHKCNACQNSIFLINLVWLVWETFLKDVDDL